MEGARCGGRGSLAVGLALGAAVLCGTGVGVGTGDVVTLKGGGIRRGRVVDPGRNWIDVVTADGTVRVPKRDVARIAFSAGEEPVEEEKGLDRVITRDGREIAGKVRHSEDGLTVYVRIPGGEVAIPQQDVLRIVGPGGRDPGGAAMATKALLERIPRWIEGLGGPDADAAERRLREAGIFAVQALEKARDGAGEAARPRIRRILRAHELRKAVGDAIDARMSSIYKDLEGDDARRKIDVLKAAFLVEPDEAARLLVFVLEDPDEAGEVRSFAAEFLRRLNRNRELLEVYTATRGPAQLAVAMALGENGIYIGIPALVEALEFDEPPMRRLAIEHLVAWTGADLGYRPDAADPEERAGAIKRWRVWWESNREAVEREARLHLYPPQELTPERIRAVGLWADANREWARRNFDDAERFLRRAVLADPTFANTHLSLGIFLCQVRRKFVEAGVLLRKVAERRFPRVGAPCQILAFYHLGELYARTGRYEEARRFYRKALLARPGYIDALISMAELEYADAMRTPGLDREERKRRIDGAMAAYRRAIDAIDRYMKSLVTLRVEEIPIGEKIPFQRREHNRSLLDLRRYLRQEKATLFCALARAALAKRDAKSAQEFASQAVRAKTDYVPARLLLARTLEGAGDRVGAAREYREALRRDPENPDAKAGLERVSP